MKVCDTKRLYDTEFEAEIACSKWRGKGELIPYRCGTHWHLTHKDRSLRRGFGGNKKYTRCPDCKDIFRTVRAVGHKCPKKV